MFHPPGAQPSTTLQLRQCQALDLEPETGHDPVLRGLNGLLLPGSLQNVCSNDKAQFFFVGACIHDFMPPTRHGDGMGMRSLTATQNFFYGYPCLQEMMCFRGFHADQTARDPARTAVSPSELLDRCETENGSRLARYVHPLIVGYSPIVVWREVATPILPMALYLPTYISKHNGGVEPCSPPANNTKMIPHENATDDRKLTKVEWSFAPRQKPGPRRRGGPVLPVQGHTRGIQHNMHTHASTMDSSQY